MRIVILYILVKKSPKQKLFCFYAERLISVHEKVFIAVGFLQGVPEVLLIFP